MSEMVERVASAIERANNGTPSIGMKFSDILRLMAVAAIEEMREPTEEMCVAANIIEADCLERGQIAAIGRYDDPNRVAWQTMIDEALKP
jgi:hypothetical protein